MPILSAHSLKARRCDAQQRISFSHIKQTGCSNTQSCVHVRGWHCLEGPLCLERPLCHTQAMATPEKAYPVCIVKDLGNLLALGRLTVANHVV